jgi:hypothetical protein
MPDIFFYGLILGMLVGWLLTMCRQRWHDEYVTHKKGDRDNV